MDLEIPGSVDRKYALVAVVLVAALAIGFLSTGLSGTGADPDYRRQADAAAGSPVALDGGQGTERKKATRISIDLEVRNVREAQRQTRQVVQDYGGWVSSSSFDRDFGTRGRLTVKVPENSSSTFLSELGDRWKVDSRRTETEDVTERYTELELELENRRNELRQLEEMQNRTGEVESLIKIQERMSELRSRIQYLENQLNQLDRRVEYTTITIGYEQPEPFSSEFDPGESFRNAYRAFFRSLELIIVGLGYLAPFLAVFALAYYGRKIPEKL